MRDVLEVPVTGFKFAPTVTRNYNFRACMRAGCASDARVSGTVYGSPTQREPCRERWRSESYQISFVQNKAYHRQAVRDRHEYLIAGVSPPNRKQPQNSGNVRIVHDSTGMLKLIRLSCPSNGEIDEEIERCMTGLGGYFSWEDAF
jgi:hypothetical protein